MIDARDRVRGHIVRVADVKIPDLAEAALVRSPLPAARIDRLDVTAVRRAPGVLVVVTPDELADAGLDTVRFGTIMRDQPILAVSRVRHVGEPMAIVVARSRRQARAAVGCADMDLVAQPAVFDAHAALTPGAPLVNDFRETNELLRWGYARGDLDAARAASHERFRGRWTSPVAQVASLETHAVTAHWPAPDQLEIWTTTQSPSWVALELARIFGLDAEAVRLHVPPLGGAFGGKNHAKLEPIVALAARLAGCPVRFVNSRAEEFVTISKHAMTVEIESGVDADGRFLYRTATLVADGGAYANSSPVIPKTSGAAVLGPYRMEAAAVDSTVVYTNNPPAGSFRGLGVSQAAWASEQQVDEIAERLSVAPLELRQRNLVRAGERIPVGNVVQDAHWDACLEEAVRLLDTPPSERPMSVTVDAPWLRRGRGIAVVMKATMSPFKTTVRLSMNADGHVEVRASAVDMGQGARTVLAYLTAEALDVPLETIRVIDPDTSRTPFDATSSSSRTTYQHARAIHVAAERLREHIEEVATIVSRGVPKLSYARGRVEDDEGGFDMAFDELLRHVGRDELSADGEHINEPARDPLTGEPDLTTHWHQGAVAVELLVDIDTGHIQIERAVGAAWGGRVISEAGARLQNDGNVIFGLGPTLIEEVLLAEGVPLTTSLRDYRIPSIRDVPPDLRTSVLVDGGGGREHPHGLGESLIPAVSPAVANALADAVGVRVHDLPLHPERVLAAIDAARDARS